jgi:hypothetical protein
MLRLLSTHHPSEKSSNHKLFTSCFTANQISDTVFSSPCQKAMWAFTITWHPLSLYRGPSTDASYQVSLPLAEGFQRRRLKCEKLTDNGCQVMVKAHIAFWQGELKTVSEIWLAGQNKKISDVSKHFCIHK